MDKARKQTEPSTNAGHGSSDVSGGPTPGTVFVVDDDSAMRQSLQFLIESHGYHVETFPSAEAFLEYYQPSMRGCLLLDVRMPGMGGLKLQETLRDNGHPIPVILLTAHGDVPMAVKAMRAGAFDFIEKPSNDHVLLDRIAKALQREQKLRDNEQVVQEVESGLSELSPREREVMELVVTGMLNKQIAAELGISIKTVEVHRARVMEKMQAESLAELVRKAIIAGVE
ncbi:response regulator transcription factor [Planctomycetales bacterium ZRK34]|nr:response regulator transcription factor [Planctomycetales bacterium ZRK34]